MNFKTKIKRICKEFLRKKTTKSNRDRLKNTNFTIISSNCLGGIIYHELGVRFNSPTINMYFEASDYIKFLKNLNYYLNVEIKPYKDSTLDYPVAIIDDIKLYCVHYNSFNEVKELWERRCKRVNKDNLFVIMTQRDGCTENDINEFNELSYKNKVIFVNEKYKNIESAYYIKNTDDFKNNGIIDLSKYISIFSGKRYIDLFDYVSFLNNETKYNK